MEVHEVDGQYAVLLFGFLGSTARHRAKYAEVYLQSSSTERPPFSVLSIAVRLLLKFSLKILENMKCLPKRHSFCGALRFPFHYNSQLMN